MDSLLITRYNPKEENENNTNREDILREKLLKKVEERRKKRDQCVVLKEKKSMAHEERDDIKQIEPPKKKRKKKKSTIEVEAKEEKEEETAPMNGFMVLGNDEKLKRKKAKRVLPNWLNNPSVVSVDLKNLNCPVDSIPQMDQQLVNILKKNNISQFFPVQSQVIPWLLKPTNSGYMYWPSDICVSAPTGSGKTLSFVLPIVQKLQNRLSPQVRALVVLPVYDLAKQVFNVFRAYTSHTSLKVILLSSSLKLLQEQKLLVKADKLVGTRSLVDIIVATPGRLVDHIKNTPGFSLKHLRFLVIDEADRVMEGVQNDWLYHLNMHLNLHTGSSKAFQTPPLCLKTLQSEKRPPQKLLFSATLSQDPEKLQQLGLFQPKLFTSVVEKTQSKEAIDEDELRSEFIGKYTTPAELVEKIVVCSLPSKPVILFHLIQSLGWTNVICFTKSCQSAHRLATVLKAMGKRKLRVREVSSKCSTETRNKRLRQFSNGTLHVIVCSDALARGIDIPNVSTVVSYDAPKFIKNHVHRIGRTGRAGNEGTAVTLLLQNEVISFKKMLQIGGKTNVEEITVSDEEVEKYANLYQLSLMALKKKLDVQKSRRKRAINIRKGVKMMKKKAKPKMVTKKNVKDNKVD